MAVIKFIGHAAFEVTNKDGKKIYFDPFLTGNGAAQMKVEDIKEAAAVFVTHGHYDHLGDGITIAKATGAPLVSTPEMSFYCAKTEGWPYGENTYPLAPSGSATIAGMKVYATPALHGSDITWLGWDGTKDLPYPGGGVAIGFVVEVEPGVRVYYSGDTGLFYDMKLIAELYEPTVAILHMGGRYGMGAREAAIAAGWLKVQAAIPMHYYTSGDDQRGDPDEFVRLVAEKSPGVKAVILQPGETYTCGAAVATA